MTRTIRAAVLLLPLMLAGKAGAAEFGDVLWLTEMPPLKQDSQSGQTGHQHAGHEHHAMGMAAASAAAAPVPAKKHVHDGTTEISLDGESPGKDHRPGKQVWLRQGDDIKAAKYVATPNESERLTIIDLNGRKSEAVTALEHGRLTLGLNLPEIGFHDVYLEQRSVRDGRLQVQLPKVELLWASCSAKEVDEEAVAKPIVNAGSPLELVREHLSDEGCMVRIVSGDAVNFRVLSFGRPVANVPVTMVTQEGWRNTRVSDENGRVTFTLIREYYPKWLEFKKFHTDTFLTIAEMDREETGEFDGMRYTSAHYIATLPGKYRPSPYDYRSYAWGLGISSFVIVFGGLSVYLYRRRRLKPYQEERVDDRA